MSIKELLTAERVTTNVEAKDWEEAVRSAGRLLVDTGVVEERYIEGMINMTKELGAYIVIAPGLAIPHSRPEDGVIEPCMAVVTLDPPIPFGHIDNDPVRVLIAFGAVDSKGHVEALSQMATILSDKENYQALMKAKTKKEVLAIMWSCE